MKRYHRWGDRFVVDPDEDMGPTHYESNASHYDLCAEIIRLATAYDALQKECDLRKSIMDRMPLCPDHRDKQTECPACRAERFESEVERLGRVVEGWKGESSQLETELEHANRSALAHALAHEETREKLAAALARERECEEAIRAAWSMMLRPDAVNPKIMVAEGPYWNWRDNTPAVVRALGEKGR